MKRMIFILLIVIAVSGCQQINSLIPPEKQCALLKSGARTGTRIALQKLDVGTLKNHKENVASILQNQILPKLKGEMPGAVKREDLDWALTLLNKELSPKVKLVVQNSIDLLLVWTPDFPTAKSDSVGSQLLKNVICLFEGILEGILPGVGIASVKNPQEIKLKFKSSACNCCK